MTNLKIMKKMRKSFSLIAVLVCAVLCTQISAYAAEAEPDVSAISNAEIVSVSEESTTYIVRQQIGCCRSSSYICLCEDKTRSKKHTPQKDKANHTHKAPLMCSHFHPSLIIY